MSEQPAGQEAGHEQQGQGQGQGQDRDREGDRISTLEAISARIDALAQKVERALSGGGPAPRGEGAGSSGDGRPATRLESAEDRRAEIRSELTALRQQEAEEAGKAALTDRVGKLERKFEQAPRQLRRVEKVMGWHGRDRG